jgi:hypothetical protein
MVMLLKVTKKNVKCHTSFGWVGDGKTKNRQVSK